MFKTAEAILFWWFSFLSCLKFQQQKKLCKLKSFFGSIQLYNKHCDASEVRAYIRICVCNKMDPNLLIQAYNCSHAFFMANQLEIIGNNWGYT